MCNVSSSQLSVFSTFLLAFQVYTLSTYIPHANAAPGGDIPCTPPPRLPLAFYLKLFGHEIGVRERVFTWVVMLLSLTISVVGTVWAFLPKSLIGAE